MKKKKSERTSRLFAFLHWLVGKIYLFFNGYKIKYINKKELRKYKDGFILISNHYSTNDHFLFASSLGCRRISYVVSNHYIMNKKTAWAIKVMRAITKEQFKNDINAIRKVKRILDEKGIVYIAPAGQVTLIGADNFIPESIVKLVRFGKVPVVALIERGVHLAKPKWSTKKRKYPVEIEFKTVIEKEDLNLLSDNEIYQKIVSTIEINDYLIQKQKLMPIKSKGIIEGLEGALYICPKCKKKLVHETNGNIMKCSNCKNTVIMNKYGFLEPETKNDIYFEMPYEWYRFQKEQIKSELLKNTFEAKGDVVLRLYDENKRGLIDAGFGKLILTKDEFYYEGTEYGKEIRKDFDLANLIQTPFSPHSHIEVPDNEKFYQFKPIDKKTKVIIWVIAIDCLYELRIKNHKI